MNKITGIIAKYRKEAHDVYNSSYTLHESWRTAILEVIFRPKVVVPGKEPMSHLHPQIDKLHLPHGVYIADWRKYRVEDHPALVAFQKRCHAAGLHDPWLRNYAFCFYPNMRANLTRTGFVTMGIRFGFLAALGLYTAEKIYDYFYPTEYIHSKEYLEEKAKHNHHH